MSKYHWSRKRLFPLIDIEAGLVEEETFEQNLEKVERISTGKNGSRGLPDQRTRDKEENKGKLRAC